MSQHAKVSVRMFIWVLFLLMLWPISSSIALDVIESNAVETKKIDLISGKSAVLKTAKPITRISEPSNDIVELVALSPTELFLKGKSAGLTNLIIWHDKQLATVYDIEVAYDISRLREKMKEILPDEENLLVSATNNNITLAGQISSIQNLSTALSLAEAFVPGDAKDKKGGIKNLVEVGGVQQVMLEVKVAEMSRSVGKRLGINFAWANGDDFIISRLGNLSGGTIGDLTLGSAINAIFSFTSGNVTWDILLSAMKEDGLIKILAEPTLIATNGQTASFLAGGEFPIPVPQQFGTLSVDYKTYGVALVFTPFVLSQDRISLKVAPEVSELDYTTAVRYAGYVIPGLTTRKAATSIELNDGQSFALAGLLSSQVRTQIQRFPILGDLPIIGALFRSTEFQKAETELIIIVTPHLVKPLDAENFPLPTDFYQEPSDTELFLEGLMEARVKDVLPDKETSKFEGEFGHAFPETQ